MKSSSSCLVSTGTGGQHRGEIRIALQRFGDNVTARIFATVSNDAPRLLFACHLRISSRPCCCAVKSFWYCMWSGFVTRAKISAEARNVGSCIISRYMQYVPFDWYALKNSDFFIAFGFSIFPASSASSSSGMMSGLSPSSCSSSVSTSKRSLDNRQELGGVKKGHYDKKRQGLKIKQIQYFEGGYYYIITTISGFG